MMIGSSRVRASARHFRASAARSRRAASSPAAPGRAAPHGELRLLGGGAASAHLVKAVVAQVDGDQFGDRRLVFHDQDTRQAHLIARLDISTDGVAHVGALDDVDDGLGQVLGVVAHALDGLGHEHQVDARRDGARVFHHVVSRSGR
jgi:hypothetical protein